MRYLLAIIALCMALPAFAAEVTALVGATLVHPQRDAADAAARDQTIILKGNRIAAVGPADAMKPPPGARAVLDNLRKVREAGIPVVMGTDAGNAQ